MKTTTLIALSLLFALTTLNTAPLQAADDPFGDDEIGDIFAELENFESETDSETSTESDSESTNSDELQSSASEEGDDSSETQEALDSSESSTASESETTTQSSTEAIAPETKQVNSRSYLLEIPEGKEHHLLYSIPGAIEYKGMTFMNIDSPKFFNKFQKCSTPETSKITNTLARLKISQGAPLECREDMQYKFIPYKTFRTRR